jgi:DNA repair protein RecN (Recombination protein N)
LHPFADSWILQVILFVLVKLTIQNYALIRQLELAPSQHLTVITGETGAGKSIMLGALGLLLGHRADTKVLWNEAEKCVVEGVFQIGDYQLEPAFDALELDYQPETILRREISPQGKSRAFINDSPVNLDTLRSISERLMDIHSQHETLQLNNNQFQLQVVDAFAQNEKERSYYQAAWQNFRKSKQAWDTLSAQAATLQQEADFILFQLKELKSAALQPGELEKLESQQKIQTHTEEIKTKLTAGLQLLREREGNALTLIQDLRLQLQSIAPLAETYQELLARTESVRIELADLADELERHAEQVEYDPQEAQLTEDRLSTLYQLLKKHRVQETGQLISLQEELQRQANQITNLDTDLAKAKSELDQATQRVLVEGKKLSATRTKAIPALQKKTVALLRELGIPDAKIEIEVQAMEATATGCDLLDFHFSANKGIAPRPLAEVASGGEFSRFMFAIKYIMAEKRAMPTLVLDEIDTGVSGEIALRLGALMREMATRHQLLTITHLPQIAARGHMHYFVYKNSSANKTISQIKPLTEQERVAEIAQMIGGAQPSALALENARELMAR